MEVRFIHTADLQIGMKATHVASVADRVRQARLETLERIVACARDHKVDFLLIAGDLFENNTVGNDLVYQVLYALEQAAPIPVYILPGNHDYACPGSVYERPAFRSAPSHIHVMRTNEPWSVSGGRVALLPAPVTQKRSGADPTERLSVATEAHFRVGVAHGSPKIEGMYQPDDHPISLDAATKQGLHYLALGHWHSWMELDERTVMPGTPEPTKFGEESGFAALVRLKDPNRPPHIERLPVGKLGWVSRTFETSVSPDVLHHRVKEWVAGLPDLSDTLLRLQLRGPLTGEMSATLSELEEWLRIRTLYVEIDRSETSPSLSEGHLRELAVSHPFLAGLLADLSQISAMVAPDRAFQLEAAPATDGDGARMMTGLMTRAESARAPALKMATEMRMAGEPLHEPLPSEILRNLLTDARMEVDLEVVQEAIAYLAHMAGEVWQ